MISMRRTAASGPPVVIAWHAAQAADHLPPRGRRREICGTGPDRLRQRFECSALPAPTARASRSARIRHFFSDYTGPLVLREFLVAGDVPAMRFKPAYDGSDIETWARVGTRQIGGRLLACSSRRGRAARSIAR